MFEPMGRTSAVDACATLIQREIVLGKLRPGDRLPPERELAVKLGIARLTLRAALARVAAAGLIEARHGVGHVVLDMARRGSPALMSQLARAAEAVGELAAVSADLLAIRRGLARAVLERLAAITPAKEDLENLDAAIDAFAQVAARGGTAIEAADADFDVVMALITASGMVVAGLFLNPVFTTLRELPALRDAIYADPHDNVTRWRAVAAWTRTRHRDPAALLASLEAQDAKTVAKLSRTPRKTRR